MDPSMPRRRRRKRDYIGPGIFLVAIAIVLIAGWRRAHRKPAPEPIPDVATMKARLLKIVPIGTPFAKAQTTLQTHGFECHLLPPNAFKAVQPLFCSRDDAVPGQDTQRWQVVVMPEHDAVQDLAVVRTPIKSQPARQ